LFLLVVVVALLAATDQASAWWGCCRPAYYGCCGCYSPCYSCWSSCCGCDGWYLGWRPGPIRRLLFGRYRWYYGGGCYSGCYDCCYSGCGYYDVGCCGAAVEGTAPKAQPTPTPAQTQKPVMEAPQPAPTPSMEMPKEPSTAPSTLPDLGPSDKLPGLEPSVPTLPGEPKSTSVPTPENSGVITVWVPFDAKVTVNGRATKSTGSRRQFVSYGLKPGYSYKYEIHAEVARNGQLVEEDRTVVLTMGQDTAVVFGLDTHAVENLASTR
jgi:uncharacterized protein (TIGR03000 family)